MLGVSGGISAYKAVELASKLTGGGAVVKTVMTEAACKLVGPKSFEAVTRMPVYTSMWGQAADFEIGHINLANWADVVAVMPATADIIAKAANGICDDLLSTTLCACWERPFVFAPAMNSRMWSNPAVVRNVATLVERGCVQVGPVEGRLACGEDGIGRMSETAEIAEIIEKIAAKIEK